MKRFRSPAAPRCSRPWEAGPRSRRWGRQSGGGAMRGMESSCFAFGTLSDPAVAIANDRNQRPRRGILHSCGGGESGFASCRGWWNRGGDCRIWPAGARGHYAAHCRSWTKRVGCASQQLWELVFDSVTSCCKVNPTLVTPLRLPTRNP